MNVIQQICVMAIPLLFAITLHEVAHGWVASKLGDSTAQMLGRISINPIKHIDPIGTIIIPLITIFIGGIIFGWAKPVPVNWNHLKHPRRDMAIVALAGPAANLAMAFVWAVIAYTLKSAIHIQAVNVFSDVRVFLFLTACFGIVINLFLMVLNLIPIPPLDGSRVFASLLTPRAAQAYERIEPYGIWILLALIFVLYKFLPPFNPMMAIIKALA